MERTRVSDTEKRRKRITWISASCESAHLRPFGAKGQNKAPFVCLYFLRWLRSPGLSGGRRKTVALPFWSPFVDRFQPFFLLSSLVLRRLHEASSCATTGSDCGICDRAVHPVERPTSKDCQKIEYPKPDGVFSFDLLENLARSGCLRPGS